MVACPEGLDTYRRNPNGHLRRHPDTVEERWQAIVKYPDPDKPGAWKQRSKTFEHKADAQNWRDLALVEHRRKPGYRPPSNETYGAFLTRWLDIVVDGSGNKLSTRIRYRQNAAHIQRMLGDRPLLQVSAQDIQQRYTQLKTKGLSPRTIHHVHLRTRASLATAVDWGLIPSNPALAVRPPRVRRSAIDPPTPEAVARFLQQASNHWLYALWAFLATTGVRKGGGVGSPMDGH